MAYKSKFAGKQIDDYLDSIGTKQDKLVDGVNIATINGQSLTNGGDVTIEGGAKVYNWNWSGAISGTLTQEEYDGINNADLINVSINGELSSLNIIREGGVIQLFSQRTFVENQDLQTVCLIIRIQEDKSYVLEPAGGVIPTRISQLENDNNFISSDNIKTINGESIVGSGDITIEAGSIISESDIAAMGFTKNTGTYSKPSGGIPKSDLASAVQTSLGKADTALQSYTEQYKGTVTGVKINGTTKNPSSGVVDLGYTDKQLSTSTSSSMTLSPNIYYRNTSTSLSTLTIKLGSVSNSNIINEYFVEFTTRSSGTTVSLPSTIKWANGETPTFEAGTTYQISIVNNLGVVTKFK